MAEGIQFDEDKSGSMNRAYNTAQNQSKMAQWLMKKGFASSESAAQGVMLAIVIINIIIAFVLVKMFL